VCWKPCSSCRSLHLLREEFLSAPIHFPLSGLPYRSFSGAALHRRRPSPATGKTVTPTAAACMLREMRRRKKGARVCGGLLVLRVLFARGERTTIRCRSAIDGSWQPMDKWARLGPGGFQRWAEKEAWPLVAGLLAQAVALEMAVGRFLPWAEIINTAQYRFVNCFNVFQKHI
jgi:hypothetical protein